MWIPRTHPRAEPSGPGGIVRKNLTLTLAAGALVAMACGKSKSPTSTAMNADLKRDIQLASATQSLAINPDEVTPASKPAPAPRMKKAPQAPKVVRDEHPTEMASAAPEQVAEVKQDAPQAEVVASAPAPAPTTAEAPALPPLSRPSASPGSYPGNGGGHGDGGNVGNGGGAGGVLGGIIGAVIRGGVVGDDDHCDPRGRRRGGSPTDVYYPNTGRVPPGGMGGMRGVFGRP